MSRSAVALGPFRALDAVLRIVTDDPLAEVLDDALGDLRCDEAPSIDIEASIDIETLEVVRIGADRWELWASGDAPRIGSLGATVANVLEAVNLRAAWSVPVGVPMHAASVSTAAGVIAYAGSSGSGKSTLAAAAVLDGYGYVADEVSVVSAVDLLVRPYHRPVGLRRAGAEAIGIGYPDSADGRYSAVYPWRVGGAGTLSTGGPLAAIVLVDRDRSTAGIDSVRPALALARMMEHSIARDDRVTPIFRELEAVVRRVPVFEASRAASAISDELLRLL